MGIFWLGGGVVSFGRKSLAKRKGFFEKRMSLEATPVAGSSSEGGVLGMSMGRSMEPSL